MTTSAAPKPAVKRATAPAETAETAGLGAVTRREFLYYVWGASMAMFLGACGGLILWFAYPRFREGEFGGDFRLSVEDIPEKNAGPIANAAGRFWVTHTEDGLAALYQVCTHLGCLYKWVDANGRFECPCHGSKFELNGIYIEGPAPRGTDRFNARVELADGTTIEADENGLIPIEESQIAQITEFVVSTGDKITGPGAGVESYEEV